jgi:hypothetical protein
MIINTTNYFQHIKRIGFENLPLVLKQSHTVIMTKTVNGEDWKLYYNDPDLKRMIELTFRKLEEFIQSRFINEASPKKEKSKTKSNRKNGGDKDVSGLEGTKINEQDGYVTERKFIEKTLALNNKNISKTQLNALIEELQTAIVQGKIRKSSPFKLEIEFIQKGLVSIYNAMKTHQTTIRLHENSIAMLDRALKKTNELLKSVHPEPLPQKQKDISLKGVGENSQDANSKTLPKPAVVLEPKKESVKIMSSMDFSKLNFDTIGFKGKWLGFIGDPAPGFTAMVFGMPKMGKSYLCMDFAGYLARHHGKVLYVAKEEKLNKTLQDKLMHKELAHPNLTLSDGLPDSLSDYEYVFIDSVNKYGLSSKDLAVLKEKNPDVSFVYVFQATKGGKFKGNNEFQHDVDIVIEVPRKGKAVQYGRYNQGGELDIFSTANEIKEEPVSQTIVADSLPLPQTIPTLAGIKKKEPMKQAKPLEQKVYEEIFVRIKQLSKANELLFKEKSPNWGTVATLANLHSALGHLLEDGYAKHFGYSKTLEEGLKRHHDANKELLQTITSKAKELKKNNELMTISDWWGYLSRQADFLGQFLDIGTRDSEKESTALDGSAKVNPKVGTKVNQKFKLQMVADITEPYTKSALKKIWAEANPTKRQAILNKGGFSMKYANTSFEDLTPAIQQSIVRMKHELEASLLYQADPKWTEPAHFPKADWKDLKTFYGYYREGNFLKAVRFASHLDTMIREIIPQKIYDDLGCKNPPFFD